MKNVYVKTCLLLLFLLNQQAKAQNNEYDIGVFYMPYWYYSGTDPMANGNWKMINDYDAYWVNKGHPEKARIPLNDMYWPSPVWYDEKMPSVTEKQFKLMHDHEIDFAVIDSYWKYFPGTGYAPSFEHVINNIVQPGFNFNGMKFALMWAGDFTETVALNGCDNYFSVGGGLDQMVTYWSQFISHPQYKRINGKPVLYIFYPGTRAQTFNNEWVTNNIEGMCGYCETNSFFTPLGQAANETYINSNKTKFLLEKLEEKFGQDMYFVAVMTPNVRQEGQPESEEWNIKYDWLVQHTLQGGYDAVTSYGYKHFSREDEMSSTPTITCAGATSYNNWNYDYAKMQTVHNQFYNYMINNTNIDYQVPVSAGWNGGPLNMLKKLNGQDAGFAAACNDYTAEPLDLAISTPTSFEQSLYNAKAVADAYPGRTKKTIMISAWNEYHEGTVIEPSNTWGYQYIERIRDVFAPITPCCIIMDAKSTNPLFSAPNSEIFTIFPNPIQNDYKIKINQLTPGQIKVSLYTIGGKLVRKVAQEYLSKGTHEISASINNLKLGPYYFMLETGGQQISQKVIVR